MVGFFRADGQEADSATRVVMRDRVQATDKRAGDKNLNDWALGDGLFNSLQRQHKRTYLTSQT
jgi:hypothetical protein